MENLRSRSRDIRSNPFSYMFLRFWRMENAGKSYNVESAVLDIRVKDSHWDPISRKRMGLRYHAEMQNGRTAK